MEGALRIQDIIGLIIAILIVAILISIIDKEKLMR